MIIQEILKVFRERIVLQLFDYFLKNVFMT